MAKQKYTQDGRPIAVTTPLGKDVLLLEAFTGTEELSRPFRFKLHMLAEQGTKIDFDKLLGQQVTVTVVLPGGKKRYVNGIVVQLSQGDLGRATASADAFIRYRAEVVPAFWLLTRKASTRVFQQLSVPDILKKVLTGVTGLKVSYELQGTFEPRDYCTQYRESDFDFASRLMEEEGIYYFFKHTETEHKMVVANSPQSHPDVPGETKLIYDEVAGGIETEQRVRAWEKIQGLRSGKVTLWDYCFEMPDKNLAADQSILATAKAGTVSHKLKVGGNDAFEIYDYPGGYAGRFDGVAPGGGSQASNLQKIFTDNKRTVGIRMDQEAAPGLHAVGKSDCRHFTAGHKFTLSRHLNADGPYVLTRVEHDADLRGAYAAGKEPYRYHNTFHCLPLDLPFRPLRQTPRPLVHGTQTAVVVGPSGQEIFTDKYGRVKVQFPWDREGKKDASSSCWVRVGTPWAGKNWGMIHIPRIGQEVIVAFLEGDPDQPIIVGSVYNFENMPPYVLPDYMTMSGLKTRSTMKGEIANFNELRFEDKKGSEEVYFHAEKNFTRVVENNDSLTVGSNKADDGSQTIEIWKDRTETVKTGDETVTIEKGSRTHNVKKDDTLKVEGKQTITITGDRTETVKQGSEKVTLEQGSRTHDIKQDDTLKVGGKQTLTITGDRALTVQTGNLSTKVSAGTITIEAAQSIELKVGGNSIKIDMTGVTITAAKVAVSGQAQVQISAPNIQIG